MDLHRGKSKETGDWIIGAAICIGNEAYILGTERLFPERPAYHTMAIGAGLEDADITDRYEAAAYGWTEALDRYEENFPTWIEVIPETVTRCTGKHDIAGNVLFEGDVYRNPDNLVFEICYGKYQAYCPADKVYMENVGFFVISDDTKELYGVEAPMPLGDTEEYAVLVGNIFDNPQLKQNTGQDAGQDADQPTLRPATQESGMREILFRGKRTDDGEWEEGNVIISDDRYFIMPTFGVSCIEEKKYKVTDKLITLYAFEIDPETACQYTGLKDKNGKEIYEGDIVKVEHEKYEKENEDDFPLFPETVRYERNYAIEFVCKGGHCGYRCRNKSIHFAITPNVIYNHKVEIIGNIFDNPELIEQEFDFL